LSPDGRSHFNPQALLEALVGAGTDFIVVGGLAVAAHGVVRATNEVDICPAYFDRNLGLLESLLGEIATAPPDFRELRAKANLRLQTSFGPLALAQNIAPFGARSFAILDRHAERLRIGSIEVRVAGYDELLAIKQAAGGEQELIDVADLKAARREL